MKQKYLKGIERGTGETVFISWVLGEDNSFDTHELTYYKFKIDPNSENIMIHFGNKKNSVLKWLIAYDRVFEGELNPLELKKIWRIRFNNWDEVKHELLELCSKTTIS